MTFGVIASFALLFGGIAILAIGFIRGGKEKKKSKGAYVRVMNQPASKTSLEKSIPSAKASTKLRTNNSSNSTNDISNPAHPLNPLNPMNPIHASASDNESMKKSSSSNTEHSHSDSLYGSSSNSDYSSGDSSSSSSYSSGSSSSSFDSGSSGGFD